MFKTIVSVLLAVTFAVAMPMIAGCEEKDEIKVEKRTNIKDMPTGETKTKID